MPTDLPPIESVLGTISDIAIAARYGVTRDSVRRLRGRLNVPALAKPSSLAGADLTRPYAELMAEYGAKRGAVKRAKERAGVPPLPREEWAKPGPPKGCPCVWKPKGDATTTVAQAPPKPPPTPIIKPLPPVLAEPADYMAVVPPGGVPSEVAERVRVSLRRNDAAKVGRLFNLSATQVDECRRRVW